MKLKNRRLSTILLAVISLSIGFIGCEKEDVLAPEEFAPPTNLKALSMDGAVKLSWTAAPAADADFFVGYRIMTKQGTTLVDSVQVGKTIINHTVSQLTNGQSYTFSIRSVKDNKDVSKDIIIIWGPTIRYAPARIYEFDSQNPSGLQFSTGTAMSFSSVNKTLVDLWIDGRSNSTPLLKSPHDQTISTGWKTTQFVETVKSSLDEQVDVPAISEFRSSPGLPIVNNKVYFARTSAGNYVRFQVVGGVQDTAPNRYVDIRIAFNSGFGTWAKR
ncbi:MAG: fibronectin type III domain-containing protein [Bacteroidota bacterium]|nr:fibronectin type III domain-containing protein [Bacteroidota bacterium]